MKIFITGGSGLVGQYLNIALSEKHEILTQYHTNKGNCSDYNSIQLAIDDYEAVNKAIQEFQPDVVVHTAAIPAPEKADALPADKVYSVNVNATKNIAELCKKYHAKMIYTSTDLVYAGYRGSMLNEESKLIPISLYAETKLMGEIKVQEIAENYIIVRLSLQIGFGLNHSKNNFHKMFDELKKGNTVNLFTDQFRTPITLKESARVINELLAKDIKNEIINLAGNERVSRNDIGELTCELAGFDKKLLNGIKMDDAGLAYKVADVSMSNEKLKSYGIKIHSLRESLKDAINEYENKK